MAYQYKVIRSMEILLDFPSVIAESACHNKGIYLGFINTLLVALPGKMFFEILLSDFQRFPFSPILLKETKNLTTFQRSSTVRRSIHIIFIFAYQKPEKKNYLNPCFASISLFYMSNYKGLKLTKKIWQKKANRTVQTRKSMKIP